MSKYAVALFFIFLLLLGCNKNGAMVTTPLNSYTKEDIITKAEDYCKKYNMIPSEVRADKTIWKQLIEDVIREYVYADLEELYSEKINSLVVPEIREDEIRSNYEMLLNSQKQYFTEKKEIVSAAVKYPRDTIVYYPPGLKWVKYFIVPFKAEIRGKAAILLSEGKIDEYEKHIQAAEADILPLIRELRYQIRDSISFDTTALEYSNITEDLLYEEDGELFPAQLAAVKALQKPGDITEYNIYQGHVFLYFDREPDYIEVPYEKVKEELAAKIIKNRTIIQHDKLMKKLYEEAIAAGSVKIKNIEELNE